MGQFSNTPEDTVQFFRCGCWGRPGCGKILTEGQVEKHGKCPKCGSRGVSPFYPETKWQMFKCYVKLILRGEAWVPERRVRERDQGN